MFKKRKFPHSRRKTKRKENERKEKPEIVLYKEILRQTGFAIVGKIKISTYKSKGGGIIRRMHIIRYVKWQCMLFKIQLRKKIYPIL